MDEPDLLALLNRLTARMQSRQQLDAESSQILFKITAAACNSQTACSSLFADNVSLRARVDDLSSKLASLERRRSGDVARESFSTAPGVDHTNITFGRSSVNAEWPRTTAYVQSLPVHRGELRVHLWVPVEFTDVHQT